jgi:hypothetical protein
VATVTGAANDQGPAPKKPRLNIDPFAELRDGAAESLTEIHSVELSCEQELTNYKAMRTPAVNVNNPLLFWSEHKTEYPIMAATARRILCVSASSAQSERDFSSIGHTITDMRSRLSSEKVEAIELTRWGMKAGLI